jgi:hypothetical protein
MQRMIEYIAATPCEAAGMSVAVEMLPDHQLFCVERVKPYYWRVKWIGDTEQESFVSEVGDWTEAISTMDETEAVDPFDTIPHPGQFALGHWQHIEDVAGVIDMQNFVSGERVRGLIVLP